MFLYLDESGDLGWKFDAPYRKGGSSRYLTIATLRVSPETKHLPKRLIQKLYKKFNWPTTVEKKWANMKFEEKLWFAERASELQSAHPDEIRYFAITVNKERVDAGLRHDPNLLYNYMIGLSLLDEMKRHPTIRFVPDPRSIKIECGNSLQDYLQLKLWYDLKVQTRLETIPCDSAMSRNVQFADMLSGVVQSHHEDKKSAPWQRLEQSTTAKRLFF